MDEAGEADVGEVAGGTEYAFEVPDGFGARRRLGRVFMNVGLDEGENEAELTLQDRSRRGILRHCFCQRHQ